MTSKDVWGYIWLFQGYQRPILVDFSFLTVFKADLKLLLLFLVIYLGFFVLPVAFSPLFMTLWVDFERFFTFLRFQWLISASSEPFCSFRDSQFHFNLFKRLPSLVLPRNFTTFTSFTPKIAAKSFFHQFERSFRSRELKVFPLLPSKTKKRKKTLWKWKLLGKTAELSPHHSSSSFVFNFPISFSLRGGKYYAKETNETNSY